MKITPMGSGSGAAGVMSAPTGQSTSPDRREAAKQAFLGETPTRVTPLDVPEAQQPQNIKRIKMRVNRSPERMLEEIQNAAGPQEIEASDSVDPNVQADPPAEVTQPISPQFAALARQRRALQVKESEIKAREEALAKQPSGIDLAKLKADPLSVLQEAGVTYDQLTESILNSQSGMNPELQALRAELKALKEGVDTKLTERDQQVEQQVLSEMKREADRLTAQGEAYEMIRENGRQQDVVDLIHRTWKQTGEVLDVTEAAELVENTLLEDAIKQAKLTKVQSKLTPVQQMVQNQRPSQMRTLTNRDTASIPLSPKARAMAAFNGTLKR